MLRRINLSTAIIVLVCFLLLWLIPLLMCALIVLVLLRVRPARPQLLGLLSTFAGVVVIVAMNRERTRAHDESGLIAAQLTGWFWLGFIAAGVVAITGIAILLRRSPEPGN